MHAKTARPKNSPFNSPDVKNLRNRLSKTKDDLLDGIHGVTHVAEEEEERHSQIDIKESDSKKSTLHKRSSSYADEATIKKGIELAKTRSRRKRRSSLVQFDTHAKARVEKASHGFIKRKYMHLALTALTALWAALCFWCLLVYMGLYVTMASNNEWRFYLSLAFYMMTKFFEVTGGVISEEADVVAIQTYAPGHQAEAIRAEKNLFRTYDNYGLWRLTHRISFVFIAFKRSFYLSLFVEVEDIGSFFATGLAAAIGSVFSQVILTSHTCYNIQTKCLKRREYKSMAREHRLTNLIDGFSALLYYCIFFFYFLIAKLTENKYVYPYRHHANKPWSVLGYSGIYTFFVLIGTCLTFLYQEKFLPPSDTGHNVRWLFQFEDRRLYFACIMILAHCGLDPYFALATNNMSDQIPCDQALISGGESAGFTNMTNSSRMI